LSFRCCERFKVDLILQSYVFYLRTCTYFSILLNSYICNGHWSFSEVEKRNAK
ncbi:hypothetical protein TNCV_278321, partial [Trichonephila clavipes]